MKITLPQAVRPLFRLTRHWPARVLAPLLLFGFVTQGFGQSLSASMSFPQFNSSYLAGTTLTIQATATTPAGTTITKVEFFVDAAFSGNYAKIGEALTAPYSATWTAPTVPANGRSYQFRAVVTNSANATAVQSGTGYASVRVYPTTNATSRNWYVNATAPAVNTAGTEAAPLNTIQKAADQVAPGDTVFVMAGRYTGTGLAVVVIQRTGTPTQPITFMPYKTDKPVVALGNNNFDGFRLLPAAAYIRIQGFEVIGNNASVTLEQARQQPGACEGPTPTAPGTARFNNNGISLNGNRGGNLRPHHVVIARNTVHDCGGGGIGGGECDYVTIENNVVYNNSWYTIYGTSGINIINAWNYDNTTTTPRIIIRNNRSFGNILKIAWNIGGTGTNCKFFDGNGIILDNNRGTNPTNPSQIKNSLGDYTGTILVENNLCYLNGGRGININYSDKVLVINNTTYRNGQSDGPFGVGIDNELIMQGSIGSRIFNNIFYGKSGELPTSVSGSSDVQQNNNLTFSDFNDGYFTGGQNITGQDPLFKDAANGDFQLLQNSPALNMGSTVAGQFPVMDILGITRPQGSGIDIGAYELVGAPVSITTQPAASSAVCEGTPVNVSVNVSGIVQSYQWYRDGQALTGVASATTATLSLPNVSTSDAGSYSVVITAFTNLTSTAFSLTVNSPPTATLTPSSGTLTCAMPSLTLTAGGGTSYVFSGGTPLGLNQLVVSSSGVYLVTATDANGCSATATATIESSTSAPTATLTASSSAICAPATGPPTAITLTAGGGSSYTFSTGATQLGSTNQATVTQSGTYSVTVSTMNGCTAIVGVWVTINTAPAAPTLTNASRTINQSNTALPLDQFVNTTNGNTLSFSGANGSIANPPTANISQPGIQSFSVTQTSTSGCTSLPTTFTITIQQSTTTTTPASQTVCRSSTVVLASSMAGSRYEWYKNGQSAPFKLTEIASIQKGTATSSLTIVSAQTTAIFYCKVFQPNGSFAFNGPFQVAVNYGCIAPGARQAAADVPLAVQLLPNPIANGQLRAIVTGAAGQPLTVQLLDLNGRVVYRQDWSEADATQSVEWDVNSKPAGLYLLYVQSLSQGRILKVVKQN